MKKQIIARGTVHGFLKQKSEFSLNEVCDTIIKRGGILRVSMGVTISEYLNEFIDSGIIKFSIETNKYHLL